MAHRVNVVLDDDAWALLERVPRGQRSRFVSAAVREAAVRRARRRAMTRLDALRAALPEHAGTAEEWVRAGREER